MAITFLLDTHVVLWWFGGHARLDAEIREEIAGSDCFLSAASVWEVAIKFKLGKLPVTPGAFLGAAHAAGFRLLSVTPEHAAATADLPAIHTDPFDRILLTQARYEHLTLLTADSVMTAYGTNVRCLK